MLWALVSIIISFGLVGAVLLAVSAVRVLRQTEGGAACPAMPDIESACDDFEIPSFNGLGGRVSLRKSKTGKQ